MAETAPVKVPEKATEKVVPRAILIPEKKRTNSERYLDWALAAGLGGLAAWALTDGLTPGGVYDLPWVKEESEDPMTSLIEMLDSFNTSSVTNLNFDVESFGGEDPDNNGVSADLEKLIETVDSLDEGTNPYDIDLIRNTEDYKSIEFGGIHNDTGKYFIIKLDGANQEIYDYVNKELMINE